jgi:hypothetical protein
VLPNAHAFCFANDTIVAAKTLQNLYYNPTTGDQVFTVFYTKTHEIEGFLVGMVVFINY